MVSTGAACMRGRRRRIAAAVTAAGVGVAIVAVAALGPATRAGAQEDYPAPANGVFTLAGHGFGHGHGMSQYGAKGAALSGLTDAQILDFYYPGTTATSVSASSPIRVRLMAASPSSVPVQGASGLAVRDAATGTVYPLADTARRYRIVADAAAMHVQSSTDGGVTWSTLTLGGGSAFAGPMVFQGPPSVIRLYFPDGTARDYEGTLTGVRSGSTTLFTVNTLVLDKYVAGVLPREMPSYWPAAALRAQSVAARTYGVAARISAPATRPWDICDTTACQVYGGRRLYSGGQVIDLQPAAVLAAVAGTPGQIRSYAGAPIFAQFSSSNGGWTSANPGFPYLVAKADPYDSIDNPYANWTVTLSVGELAACFPAAGTVYRLSILSRDGHGQWGGRIVTARLYGRTAGGTLVQQDITGDGLRRCKSAAGFRSTYATVTSTWTTSAAPAGIRAPSGDLDVFARGPLGDVMHRRYIVGQGWQPWRSLGGVIVGAPTVYRQPTGTLVVWARGTNGQLYSGALQSGQWLGWKARGGVLTSRPYPVMLPDASLFVFFRGGDGALWYGRWAADGSWLGWRSLGGKLPATGGPAGAATGGSGVRVVAAGSDGALSTRSLTAGGWGPWQPIGGSSLRDVAAASPSTGVFDVYIRTGAGTLGTRRAVGTSWGAWQDLGGGLAAGPWADAVEGANRTEIWIVGTNGLLYLRVRTSVWGSWQRLPS
jgi:stage II sporulation protein D